MNNMLNLKFILLFLISILFACTNAQKEESRIIVGAEQTETYFPLLKGKKIGVIANQTSMIGNTHLIDSLIGSGFNVRKAFGPEHGFRGDAADGEKVDNTIDRKTGIQIVSLYGSHKKPTAIDLEGIDMMVFDIQDVGARFYTYISTMSYAMEACAENDVEFLVLDRPNPHGDYVDGPVLELDFSSFVGLHPVPVVHGMTVGEYAKMVNEEGWLANQIQCNLQVIPVKNYSHSMRYTLPIAPSPNLPNQTAIDLYPSLCFFEGTMMSIGRGTEFPFQVIGHPDFSIRSFAFTPQSIPGVSVHPKFEGQSCLGQSLAGFAENVLQTERRLHLIWLIDYYQYFKERDDFFISYFEKLAGTNKLRQQIKTGLTEEQIRQSWQKDLVEFKKIRKKYLLYSDFE
jgi:uncharacterized protein YbbC (DUF1343 family)